MNKKNILLSTAIATTMLVCGFAMPKVFATTNAELNEKVATFQSTATNPTITVSLPKISAEDVKNSKYPTLTKSDVNTIVSEKFNKEIEIKINGETYNAEKDKDVKVGTGSTITINDKTYTLVLLGDANGNGTIDLIDASYIYNSYIKNTALTDKATLAGDYITDENYNIIDASAIYNTVIGKFNSFDKVILPDNSLTVVDADVKEVFDTLDHTMYTPKITEDSNGNSTITLTVIDKEATVDDAYNDIIDALIDGASNAMFEEVVNAYSNKLLDEITIKFGEKELNYTKLIEKENVKNYVDKVINGEYNNATVKNLIKEAINSEYPDFIKNWKDKSLTDLVEKGKIEIDVKLVENSSLLLNNFKTEKKYFIDFLNGISEN